jgi:hypothetical protein
LDEAPVKLSYYSRLLRFFETETARQTMKRNVRETGHKAKKWGMENR